MPQDEYAGDDSGDDSGDDTGDEAMGADEANVLGAIYRRMRRRKRSGGGGRPVYSRPPLAPIPQQNYDARLRSYLGIGFTSWTGTDGADKVLTVEPQESFRMERLIIELAQSAAPAGISLMRRIDIGTLPQSPSVEQAAPAAMFARDATYASLQLQIAKAGTKIQVTLGQTVAPGGVIVVQASVGAYGEWIR